MKLQYILQTVAVFVMSSHDFEKRKWRRKTSSLYEVLSLMKFKDRIWGSIMRCCIAHTYNELTSCPLPHLALPQGSFPISAQVPYGGGLCPRHTPVFGVSVDNASKKLMQGVVLSTVSTQPVAPFFPPQKRAQTKYVLLRSCTLNFMGPQSLTPTSYRTIRLHDTWLLGAALARVTCLITCTKSALQASTSGPTCRRSPAGATTSLITYSKEHYSWETFTKTVLILINTAYL